MPWKIRPSVFGSKSERDLYSTLVSQWSDRFNIYPNLPLLNIIEVDESELQRYDFDVLKRMSVDYTVCAKNDAPILSIEFDGLGQGFSRDGKYVPVVYDIADPYRSQRLQRKLDIAARVEYPLMVLSYVEKEPLGEGISLTLVDGLVGSVLANRRFRLKVDERLRDESEALSKITDPETWELMIDDLVVDAEIEADLEENPIAREAWTCEAEAFEKGLIRGHSTTWFSDRSGPAVNLSALALDPESFLDALVPPGKADWIGCRMSSEAPSGGRVVTEVRIRNISGSNFGPYTLVEDVARLLHSKKLLLGRFGEPQPSGS